MIKRLTGLASLLLVASTAVAAVDHKLWDGVLKANVDADGFVDYAGIRINRGGDLYQYITLLEGVDVKTLSDDERLAFWINAYNAHVIKFILAHPKMEKVDEDLGLFDKKFKVARLDLSLNDIENRIIRLDTAKGGGAPGFSVKELDPRIHFALNCAAIDCPKLSNHAYYATSLQEKLQANAEAFANNPKYLRVENGKLIISSLMKWYGNDFDKLGGVAVYLSSLIDPQKRPDAEVVKAALKSDFPSNAVFQYDWTLNQIKNKK